jgi:hypothetical protein
MANPVTILGNIGTSIKNWGVGTATAIGDLTQFIKQRDLPIVGKLDNIVPKITKLNVLLGVVGGGLAASIKVNQAQLEEARKFREVSQRLLVLNTTRNEGSQRLIKSTEGLIAGLRSSVEIQAGLQEEGFVQFNKEIVNLIGRLKLTGQDTTGFKELSLGLLKSGKVTESGLARISSILQRTSLSTNVSLEKLIEASKSSDTTLRTVSFLGGNNEIFTAVKAQLAAALGGQLQADKMSALFESIMNSPLANLQELGIQQDVEQMAKAPSAQVAAQILLEDIIPKISQRISSEPRTLEGQQQVQGVVGAELFAAFQDAALGAGGSLEKFNQMVNQAGEKLSGNMDRLAGSMTVIEAQLNEAFSRIAESREEEVSEFDISIMALKASFNSLGLILAPIGGFFTDIITSFSFAIADFTNNLAQYLLEVAVETFGMTSYANELEVVTQRGELISALRELRNQTILNEEGEEVSAIRDTAKLSEVLQRIIGADNANALSNAQEEMLSLRGEVQTAQMNSNINAAAEAGITTLSQNMMMASDGLRRAISAVDLNTANFANVSDSARSAILDEIDTIELNEAREGIRRQLSEGPLAGQQIIPEDELSMLFSRVESNIQNEAMQSIAQALFVISQQRASDETLDRLDAILEAGRATASNTENFTPYTGR